ncbi:PKD domain-containing protein [Angustibacter luteus]|uniref:PKD domain-containing protein n=1 Tax=Angustibacter luteus TaxID=658456 RepID=A0ABW1JB32_9ACTN
MLTNRRPRALVALAPVAALLLTGLTALVLPSQALADTNPAPGVPQTVGADILPTVQINGVVWSQVVVGNTVYAGGRFTSARPAGAPAGTGEVTRNNLLAYDITTGELITSFAPDLNAQVMTVAASPDGSRLYVGGDFTMANGLKRYRIAAYNTATGQIISSFSPGVDYKVRALTATNTTLYIAGSFSGLSSTVRTNLGAVDAITGAVLPWAPTANAAVGAMVMSPDGSRLVVGGVFTQLSGVAAYGLGALDASTGAVLPWAANQKIMDAGANAGITSLSTDGTNVYGTGYVFGSGGNFEGTFAANPNSGALVWMEDCHGDTYSAYGGMPDVVYSIGHVHFCGNVGGYPETNPRTHHHALAWTKTVGGTITRNTTGNYTNWEGNPRPNLLHWFPDPEAGTFTGQGQAAWNITGNSDYVVIGGEFPRVDGVPQQGLARFTTRALGPNQSGPVNRGGAALNPDMQSYQPGTVRFTFPATWDRDNDTLVYKLIRDNDTANPVWQQTVVSNFWTLPRLSFIDTGVAPGSTHRYRLTVTDPLGNTSLSENQQITVASAAGLSSSARQVLADGPTEYWRLGESEAIAHDWAGVDDLVLGTGVSGGQAGAITGDSDPASLFDGTSNGRGATRASAAMPGAFSIGAWVKTTTTRGGKILGAGTAASGNSTTTDRNVWLRNDGKISFGARQSGVNRILTSPGVVNNGQWHHVVATLGSAGQVLYVDGVQVASAPTVTSASVLTGYWRIGDTLSGWTGAPTSSYLAGTIDDIAVFNRQVSAATVASEYHPPNVNDAPTAAFSNTASGLDAAFDGTASSDTDGTITGYSWNFDDGGTSTSATPSHTFPAGGTYNVRLTVTDDDGATGSITKAVTVVAPVSGVVADDTFSRTVASGFGPADLGGAWTISGGNANFSVDGSAGKLKMAAGATLTAALAGIGDPSADTVVDVSLDKAQTGGGTYVSVIGRRITATTDYRAKMRFLADGRLTLGLSRTVAGTDTAIATAVTAASGVQPGDVFHVRIQTIGASPTTVRARVWKAGDAEPATWNVSATDATADLQNPGGVAVQGYLSGSVTNAPMTLTVDELHVRHVDLP